MLRVITIMCGFVAMIQCEPGGGEPMCLSRFDYDYKVLSKLVELDNMMKQVSESSELEWTKLRQKMEEQQQEIKSLTALLDTTSKAVNKFQEDKTEAATTQSSDKPSDTYVRWGKTSCPGNGTKLVYSGYAGGSWLGHSGAAVEYICLPKDPLWNKYKDGVDGVSGFVYGSEYQLDQRDLSHFFGRNIYDDNVPCAVCSTTRPSVMMIPGRNQCYGGWTVEYSGYLSSNYHGHNAASQYVCLDDDPDIIPNTKTSHDGKLFYFVEARCGALPCPPYVDGRELTCVVCSK